MRHFEILVEDQSGKRALDILVPKIVGEENTFTIHPYKGIGHIPKDLRTAHDPAKRILLDQLPRILAGYGRAHSSYPEDYRASVIIVCDLDDRNYHEFMGELTGILANCDPAPDAYFCLSVEEGEAWLLGDIPAIKASYPRANDAILGRYVNDSICGTWEVLADAVHPGGSQGLKAKGSQAVGKEKSEWAQLIPPHMDADRNLSPSFQFFRDTLRELSD